MEVRETLAAHEVTARRDAMFTFRPRCYKGRMVDPYALPLPKVNMEGEPLSKTLEPAFLFGRRWNVLMSGADYIYFASTDGVVIKYERVA